MEYVQNRLIKALLKKRVNKTFGILRHLWGLVLFWNAIASPSRILSICRMDFLLDFGLPLKTSILNGLPSESKLSFSSTFCLYISCRGKKKKEKKTQKIKWGKKQELQQDGVSWALKCHWKFTTWITVGVWKVGGRNGYRHIKIKVTERQGWRKREYTLNCLFWIFLVLFVSKLWAWSRSIKLLFGMNRSPFTPKKEKPKEKKK